MLPFSHSSLLSHVDILVVEFLDTLVSNAFYHSIHIALDLFQHRFCFF